jgi:CRP/FNR family transcriptional regulator, dissimilatory nitrate respiration regulator
MGALDNRTADFMKGLTFFAGLPKTDMEAFMEGASVQHYAKGTGIFYQGDAAGSFFVVISGWVKAFRNTVEGDEALVGLFTRGDVFAEAALFTGGSYPFSALAAEETRILVIPGDVLKKQAKNNPDIVVRTLTSMSREMSNLQRQNEQMSIMSTSQRVACLLLQLTNHMVGKGGTFTFPYDKLLAAARLGMKPETFSRSIAQLKPYGVKSKGTEIEIESFARLAEYSCGNCTALPAECRGCRLAAECLSRKAINARAG